MTTTLAPGQLTDRQRAILVWINEYIAAHGFSPTIRELVRAFGFKSTNGAVCHLQPLRTKGYVTWLDGSPRTLRVIKEVTA